MPELRGLALSVSIDPYLWLQHKEFVVCPAPEFVNPPSPRKKNGRDNMCLVQFGSSEAHAEVSQVLLADIVAIRSKYRTVGL